ncbi:PEGA domain-containing protein [Thermococcus indicus]|uniref:PEGA domain-containing protein n=1 Tax=Thermococcus indicus TaxID=2586643 RepID=A0A4Y5SMM6_9EURY|nr:PEGA domain-containing protein [Thermococcus indicus]QDA31594.1 PEGA domain-containing protein [Thermococcus indicus]
MKDKSVGSAFVMMIIIVSILFFLEVPHPYVSAEDELGYTLPVSVGEIKTLIDQNGDEYKIKVIDVNVGSGKALIHIVYPSGNSQTTTLAKNQELSLGTMIVTLKDTYIAINGKVIAIFLIYGLRAVEGYSSLLINSTPIGAEVYINQERVGYTPLTYLASVGDYYILM